MLKEIILDILFPVQPFCVHCNKKLNKQEKYLCTSCEEMITQIKPPICKKCGKKLWTVNLNGQLPQNLICGGCYEKPQYFVQARSFGCYDGVLRKVICKYKYEKRPEISEYLGKKMLYTLQDLNWPDFDFIVPVPLHVKRERERGFNQSYLLAKVISKGIKKPIFTGLIRILPTEHQTLLNKLYRQKNLQGAFEVKNGNKLHRKTILLIDDVFTTGSTVNECSRILLHAGAGKVYVLTCARG